MTGNSLAMLPWFPRDFIASTRAMRLAERGAYCDLLFYQWEMGSLPADTEALARLLGASPKEFANVWKVISEKFVKVGDRLTNRRLEEHRAKAVNIQEGKSKGAHKTNAKRWGERPAERIGERVANRHAERVDIESPPSPSPSLQNPIKTLTHTSEVSSPVRAEKGSEKGSVCGTFTKIGGDPIPMNGQRDRIPTTAEVMDELRREHGRAGK